jgi:DNA-binding response OmpR family regulator
VGEVSKKRIIYIEDEPEMIKLVRLILRNEDVELIGASGGQEGLNKIRAIRPDLVLLDIMMPGMDGWEVYNAMRSSEELKDIPVIIVTVKSTRTDVAMGLHVQGVNDYLTKPFELQGFLQSVRRFLYV